MNLGIQGRNALVLGGSKGIGRAVADELAQAGANIAVVARGKTALDTTVEELKSRGARAIGISADLMDLDSYARIVAEMSARLGEPDIAVYNLDAPPPGRYEEIDEAQLALAYHSVVLCYSRLLRAILPGMKARRWGRIVTIGSGTAKQLARGSLNFGYALANVTRVSAAALAKTAAAEVAPFGVTINTIGTGLIETDQSNAWIAARAANANIAPAVFHAGMTAHIPMGRAGEPAEMAALCAWLCSARASYTTRETILCDGGMTNSIV